jgi:tetratricopeptide (TPR) repeat protein
MRTSLTLVLVLAGSAAADTAADLLKQGVEQYKAGKYADAVITIGKAYELDPKPETLFTLAQAERLAGDCKTAVVHYRQVIERIGDFNVAKLVQQNLELCEPAKNFIEPKPVEPKPVEPKPVEPKPVEPTKPATTTVVREVIRIDKVAVSLYTAGGLALGLAGGFYFAGRDNRDAAERAGSLADHDDLADRAKSQFTIAGVSAGVGLAAIAGGVVWTMTRKTAATEIAVTPTKGGSMFVVAKRW